jgi:predicted dehydrogenase
MDKITLGVIGAGYWGPNLIRNFSSLPNCRLQSVADTDESRLKKINGQFPGVATTSNPKDIIDSDLAAVVITSSASTHYSLARQSLLAGKHVFVEKPLCLTVAEAEELVKLADERRRVLMVGHLLLYHPALKMIKDLIAAGEIGDVFYVYSTRVNLGRIRSDENALWSLCPHDISMILYLLDESPRAVFASGESFIQKGIHDVVFVELFFASTKLAHIHASWLDPHKIRKLTLVGSKKMVVFDDSESQEKLRIYDRGVSAGTGFASYPENFALRFGDIHIPQIPSGEPLRIECAHFLECITENKKPLSDGRNGLAVVKILSAAEQSLKKGAIEQL